MTLKPFDYNNPPDNGLYWVCVSDKDVDVDAGYDGQLVGVDTGHTIQSMALVWINTNPDGNLDFDSVDATNHGRVHDDSVVTHYAEVNPPKMPTLETSDKGIKETETIFYFSDRGDESVGIGKNDAEIKLDLSGYDEEETKELIKHAKECLSDALFKIWDNGPVSVITNIELEKWNTASPEQ